MIFSNLEEKLVDITGKLSNKNNFNIYFAPLKQCQENISFCDMTLRFFVCDIYNISPLTIIHVD